MPVGWAQEAFGPILASDGTQIGYESEYSNDADLFRGPARVYSLASIFWVPEGAHDFLWLYRDEIAKDPLYRPVSPPSVGEETFAFVVRDSSGGVDVVGYLVCFRQGNVIGCAMALGLAGTTELHHAEHYARIMAQKIQRTTTHRQSVTADGILPPSHFHHQFKVQLLQGMDK